MKPKRQIPNFKTEAEEARFWDTHSPLDYLSELKPVKPFTLAPALAAKIRKRHARKAA
ncbi:MAG: hypothetical protein AAB320_03690 [Elusimicrobiota bacterium]